MNIQIHGRRVMCAAALMIFSLTAFAQDSDVPADTSAALAAAREAVTPWLALLDDADYDESWETAASAFKAAVTALDWDDSVSQARGSFEPFGDRVEARVVYVEDPPNAPPGTYVVLFYQTDTAGGDVIETVSLQLEEDGSWRVGGYFVRPAQ